MNVQTIVKFLHYSWIFSIKMKNVSVAIIKYDAKILSVRRPQDKHLAVFWEFPGGKVEPNEELEECLKRELKEELDLDVVVGDYVGQSTYDYGNNLVCLHAFIVSVESTAITLTAYDESIWLAYDELDDMDWAPADIPIVHQLKTYLFYSAHTDKYIAETLDIKLTSSLQDFMACLKKNASLLDVGCGSGRDALYFKEQGFQVVVTDMVSEMAEAASKNLSQDVLARSYFNLGFKNEFDGVWASACLLHCPKSEFMTAIQNIADALRSNGVAYISLKQGEGEDLDHYGRYFSYYSEQELISLFDDIYDLSISRLWIDESDFRESKQVWINLFVRKV